MEGILPSKTANQQVMSVVIDGDDVTWQSILFDLVKNRNMDPWALDLVAVTHEFLEVVEHLKDVNFQNKRTARARYNRP